MLETPSQQIRSIVLSSFLALCSLVSIVLLTDPYSSSYFTFIFFYLSLFLFFLGLLTIVGLWLRKKTSSNLFAVNLTSSFRQGLIVSIFILSFFMLQANNLNFWWVQASLIIFLFFLELYFHIKF